ncbi:hypothetical protein EJ110_NYTH09639 [Nymphaea thermarum]|nr:hypothetical protein EJ110_NYTH09639 [Nymphaea thermarum]
MLHGSKDIDGHFVDVELTRRAIGGERQDVHSVADGHNHGNEDVRRKAAPDPADLVGSCSRLPVEEEEGREDDDEENETADVSNCLSLPLFGCLSRRQEGIPIIHIPAVFSAKTWYQSLLKHVAASEEVRNIIYTYSTILKGFTTWLTENEAELLRRLPAVLSVLPETVFQTTRTPLFLGLNPATGVRTETLSSNTSSGIEPKKQGRPCCLELEHCLGQHGKNGGQAAKELGSVFSQPGGEAFELGSVDTSAVSFSSSSSSSPPSSSTTMIRKMEEFSGLWSTLPLYRVNYFFTFYQKQSTSVSPSISWTYNSSAGMTHKVGSFLGLLRVPVDSRAQEGVLHLPLKPQQN